MRVTDVGARALVARFRLVRHPPATVATQKGVPLRTTCVRRRQPQEDVSEMGRQGCATGAEGSVEWARPAVRRQPARP